MVVEMSFFNFTYLDDSDILVMFIILSRRNIDKYFLTYLPYISYPKSILVKKPVLYFLDHVCMISYLSVGFFSVILGYF